MAFYRVADYQLYDPAGRLLLGGPMEELAAFAAALDQAAPADERALRGLLCDLIEGTSDCSFAPYIPLTDEAAADLATARADRHRRHRHSEAQFAQGNLFTAAE